MSWQTLIETITLTITTGDGKIYKPKWMDAKKNLNFNRSNYDFISKRGTFVERGEMQGRQFPMTFYFEGENVIDDLYNFEQSCLDKRPWKIKHPLYGDILAQPLDLEIDNSRPNSAKITGVLWETLPLKYPVLELSIEKEIDIKKELADKTAEVIYSEKVGTPEVTLLEKANTAANSIGTKYQSITESIDDLQTLKNLMISAERAATELIAYPTRYLREMINLINFPFLIEQTIESKIGAMLENLDTLGTIFLGDEDGGDLQYQTQSFVLLAALAQNLISSDESDYLTRSNVVSVINDVSTAYDTYKSNLDTYIEDQSEEIELQLDYIINVTLSYLYEVAFNAKQERTIILDRDNNLVTLAHQFNGPGDEALQLFINQNNITIREYINLKKGRKIIYYV